MCSKIVCCLLFETTDKVVSWITTDCIRCTGEDMPMTHPDGWDMQDASFMPGDSGRSVLVYTTGRDENIYTVLDVDTHTSCPLPVTQSQTETLNPIVFTKRDEVVFTTGDHADYSFYQPQ